MFDVKTNKNENNLFVLEFYDYVLDFVETEFHFSLSQGRTIEDWVMSLCDGHSWLLNDTKKINGNPVSSLEELKIKLTEALS